MMKTTFDVFLFDIVKRNTKIDGTCPLSIIIDKFKELSRFLNGSVQTAVPPALSIPEALEVLYVF